MRDRAGLAFFSLAALMAAFMAWKSPTILSWLAALHNLSLAVIYAMRREAKSYDRKGLILGLIAAFLPLAAPYPMSAPVWVNGIAIFGYGLVLWSVFTLGRSFGIAPADRGLVVAGPYRFVRHPMYLGELCLRGALAAASPQLAAAVLMAGALACIQTIRLLREEQAIAGYEQYARQVRFRLIPGVW